MGYNLTTLEYKRILTMTNAEFRKWYANKVLSSRAFAIACLKYLYHLQTIAEVNARASVESNGKGFNGSDAGRLTFYAQSLEAGYGLSDQAILRLQSKLLKYWRQMKKRLVSKAMQRVENAERSRFERQTTPKKIVDAERRLVDGLQSKN